MTIDCNTIFSDDDFIDIGCVIAAVSGGSDSLALLFLLQDFFRRLAHPPRLIAVTVDHVLRPESAQEARDVAALCATSGIEHKTMNWTDKKPQSALSYQARLARYRLLCEAAENYGARMIATGHTLDDQVETYLMRRARNHNDDNAAQTRGLAAMARISFLNNHIRLLRPLLGTRRNQLREYLQTRNISWVDDPSNDNPKYERVRVRRTLTDETLHCAVNNISLAQAARSRQTSAELQLFCELHPVRKDEQFFLNFKNIGQRTNQALPRLIATLASLVGGGEFLRQPTERLQAHIEEIPTRAKRMTWGGAVIENKANQICLWRECRNLGTLVLAPGATVLWDGRYRLTNHHENTLIIRPVDEQNLHMVLNDRKTNGQMVDAPHFPSLLASFAVESKDRVEIPILNKRDRTMNITFERILRPFDWLIRGDERDYVSSLQNLFYCKNSAVN